MSIAGDLDAMVTGFGSAEVVAGAVTGRGLLDEEDVLGTDAAGEPLTVRRTVLPLRRATWPDLAVGDTVAVDGVDYTLSDLAVSDGAARMGHDARVLRAVVKAV